MSARPDSRTVETLYAEMLEALNTLGVQLDELFASLKRQQRAVVGRDLKALTATLREQSHLARSIRELEERRRELTRKITGQSEPLPVSRLAEGFGEPRRSRLQEAARRIRTSAGNVEALKKQNAFLLEKARTLVTGQLRLMMELARVNRNVYEENGKKSRQTNLHKVIDQKI